MLTQNFYNQESENFREFSDFQTKFYNVFKFWPPFLIFRCHFFPSLKSWGGPTPPSQKLGGTSPPVPPLVTPLEVGRGLVDP